MAKGFPTVLLGKPASYAAKDADPAPKRYTGGRTKPDELLLWLAAETDR